jgi:hypothetical protein
MRKIVSALILSSALIFAMAVHAAAPNFAGTWVLDKSKSQGLNPRMQGADSVTWTITQTDKAITIEEKVTGGQMGGGGSAGAPPAGAPPAGGGPGGGGGRGGMMGGMGGPRTFNLDGSETTGEMGRGKFARKAAWAGDTLELVSKVVFQGPDGGEVTSTTSEKITMSGDGKTLTVARKVEGPRPSEGTYVFNK